MPAQHWWGSHWIETSTQLFVVAGVLSSCPYLERLSPLRKRLLLTRHFAQRLLCHVTESCVGVRFAIPPQGGTSGYSGTVLCGLHSSHLMMSPCVSRHRYVTHGLRDASLSDSTKVTVCSTDLRSWLWLFKGPVCPLFRLVRMSKYFRFCNSL